MGTREPRDVADSDSTAREPGYIPLSETHSVRVPWAQKTVSSLL